MMQQAETSPPMYPESPNKHKHLFIKLPQRYKKTGKLTTSFPENNYLQET